MYYSLVPPESSAGGAGMREEGCSNQIFVFVDGCRLTIILPQTHISRLLQPSSLVIICHDSCQDICHVSCQVFLGARGPVGAKRLLSCVQSK